MSIRRIFLEITYALMSFAALSATILFLSASCVKAGEYLGRVGSNPFCSDCTANPFAPINNPFNPNSPLNEFGPYGNPFSPHSANNPFATDTPQIYGTADE
jgi:hypothetical protein